MNRTTYVLFADAFQFSIQDEAAQFPDCPWSKDAFRRFLDISPGYLAVGTVRNMDVPVTIDVFDAEPELNIFQQDHIVECSVEFPTGRVVVWGNEWFPDASRIIVRPGKYKVRIHLYDLDSLSENGLEGDDRYHLEIWPSNAMDDVIVHRQYVWPELDLTI